MLMLMLGFLLESNNHLVSNFENSCQKRLNLLLVAQHKWCLPSRISISLPCWKLGDTYSFWMLHVLIICDGIKI